MNPSKISALKTEVSELKKFVKNLLDKVNKLTAENTSLREELRHLKKLKGQPKIRPGKKDSESSNENRYFFYQWFAPVYLTGFQALLSYSSSFSWLSLKR